MAIERWGTQLPTQSELPAAPRGVVVHWTGGGYWATGVDREAYHFIVEGDGSIVPGRWPVAANMRTVSGADYAAHTGSWNSYQVGIAAAGMKGYRSPAAVGDFPLKAEQVSRMMLLAEYFLELGELDPLNPLHLCSHREVWTLHGVKGTRNHQKLDIEHLPFRPDLKPDEVGDYLRFLAQMASKPMPAPPEVVIPTLPPPAIVIPPPRPPARQVPHLEPKRPWWRKLLSWAGSA